ncbi:YkoP family protein [Alicyclobacillus dauci]|uniref:Polysaccharide deacetylase n=1 Tax=Alicyclobacillus dauci TaxID=1475485 RepID=A0ABY6Z7N2_9BACL|nr:polysaccharide deacetylase [Alicyclobacillus dauci]WAH38799.1 polysaccharide deacetylase [Alicyclobacillus dauci]
MATRAFRFVFDAWESLFHKMFHLEEIEPGVEHLFFIAKRRYFGRPFVVEDVTVKSGDIVIELHMNNSVVERVLTKDENIVRAMVQLIRQARESMPVLAKAIEHEKYERAAALYGITFIHRGIDRFGFHTLPISDGVSKRITTWHLRNVLRILNPHANDIFSTHADVLEPKLVVASKRQIIELFRPVVGGQTLQDPTVPLDGSVNTREQYRIQS